MLTMNNKKAFQWDANHPLSERTYFIMNKVEHVQGGSLYSEVQVENV